MKVRRRSLSKPLCQLRRSNPPRSRSCFVFSSSSIRNLITLCDFVTLLSDKDEFNFYAVNSLGRKGISRQRSIKKQVKPNQIVVKDKTNSSMNQTIDAEYLLARRCIDRHVQTCTFSLTSFNFNLRYFYKIRYHKTQNVQNTILLLV